MSRLTIDLGTAGNPATGDSIRTAFNKVNENFTELYAELGGDSLDTISFTNNTISSGITNGTLVLQGNGTGAVDIEGIQVNDNQIITTTTNANLLLDGNGTGTVVINGLSLPTSDGTAGQVLKTDGAGNLSFTNVDPGAITLVGDDSTGTAVNIGETFKIAGTQNITTAVSGDTLTITGPDLSSYATTTYVDNKVSANNTLTIADDTSTTTSINLDNTLKVSGAGSISTSVTANTLTITGTVTDLGDFTFSGNKLSTTSSNADMELDPAGTGNLILKSGNFLPATDVNQYLGSPQKRWHTLYVGTGSIFVGDAQITSTGSTINLPSNTTIGGVNITSEVVESNITVVGDDSTGTTFGSGETIKIAGAGSVTTSVSGDTLTITGSASAQGLTFVGDDSTGTRVSDGETFKITGTQNITTAVSGDTLTITGPNLSSYLTAVPKTIDVNEISSGDSSAIQINDAVNISGALTANVINIGNMVIGTVPGDITADADTGINFNVSGPDGGFVVGYLKEVGNNNTSGGELAFSSETGNATYRISLSDDMDDGFATKIWRFDGTGKITFPDSTTQNTAAKITVVGDDSTGVTLNAGETIKIAGAQNITTAVSGDTLTITGPDLSSYLTSVPSTIEVNEISSGDSSAIQINDAVNISGALTANVINIGNASSINFDGGTGSNYSAPTFADGTGTINKAGVYKSANNANNALFSFGANGAGVMSVVMDGSLFIGSALPSNNGGLNTNFGGWLVVQSGGKFGGDINTLGGLIFDDALTAKIQFPDGTLQTTARAMTIVGDDSTGTAVNIGETFKIAGTQNITTAVSGDTLTITGPSLTNYAQKSDTAMTIVGDDSTGTAITIGETFKIQGAGSVTTSVSGDTITITGSGGGASIGDLTVTGSTITAPSNADLSLQPGGTGNVILGTVRLNGTTISSDDSTKITLAENVDITGALQVNEINSADSSAIQINDGVNVSGTLTANTFVTNNISSTESTAIQVNDGMNVTGTLTANTIQVNEISSTESSAIQVNDAINSSSTITATSFTTHGSGGSITGVNTLQVNEISSADSTAIQINDGVNVSGTLTANTLVTNNISSSESSAIQVDDAINFSGAGTFHGSVRFNAGYTEKVNGLTSSTTITVNCALASVHTVYLETNTGFVISNLPTGGSVTLIITQDSTGSRTATFGTDTSTTVKFAGGTPALSTASNSIDVVTIFNDGTNYLGNIAKAYA